MAEGRSKPIRGPLSLTVSAATPNIVAGTDFSIFVVAQNPYDVPVTLYQIQTHIPVELLDLNQVLLQRSLHESQADGARSTPIGFARIRRRFDESRRRRRSPQSGFATAVGTDYAPADAREFLRSQVNVENLHPGGTAVGIAFNFPTNPTAEDLDRIMQRFVDYRSGVVPTILQPGDTVVRQFRLKTRKWLLFTPLTHTFQIQAYYSTDGTDHNCAISYQATIRGRLAAVSLGALSGAILGSALKGLTSTPGPTFPEIGKAALIAILASVAVVIGFARKSNSQSLVSVEDFWGGVLIGVSVGFAGFDQFSNLFERSPGS